MTIYNIIILYTNDNSVYQLNEVFIMCCLKRRVLFHRDNQRYGQGVHIAKIRLSGVQKWQVELRVGRGVRCVQKGMLFGERRRAKNAGHDVLLLRRKPVQQCQANDKFLEPHRYNSRDNNLQHHEVFENAHAAGVNIRKE